LELIVQAVVLVAAWVIVVALERSKICLTTMYRPGAVYIGLVFGSLLFVAQVFSWLRR
jgi:hypothetical protein